MYEERYYEPGLPPPGVTVYLSTWYKIGEDSIKEGKVYKQILKSREATKEQWEFDCLMRKEGDKIYRDEPGRKAEYLLYDFGMNIGDTIVESRYDDDRYPICKCFRINPGYGDGGNLPKTVFVCSISCGLC